MMPSNVNELTFKIVG
jgi:hypothetical protein